MFASTTHLSVKIQRITQLVAMGGLALLGAGLFLSTILAAAGLLPWFELAAGFNGTAVPMMGAMLQIGLTVLVLLLFVYMPANARILRLEAAHRSFHMNMDDVAKAYAVAHAADRTGVFTLQSEFDAVRERLNFLRSHSDLGHMEPEILEVAAQMSRVSEELAEVYSDDKVARAKAFLQERMAETEATKARIERAERVMADIRKLTASVELEEDVAASQLARLQGELDALMPELGGLAAGRDVRPVPQNIVRIAGE